MKIVRTISLLVLVGSLASQAARADSPPADGPEFSVEQLAVDGHVQAVEAADLDGDGKLDLIAAVVKGEHESAVRSLAIFWNRGAHFEARPDLVIPLDADVCAYDFGEVDGKPGAELLILTASGVRAHSLAERKLGPSSDLVTQPTLFLRAPHDQLVRFRVAQPLGIHGATALLVPGLGNLTIYQRQADKFVARGQLEVDVNMEIATGGGLTRDSKQLGIPSFSVTAHFPSIDVVDLDGDGRLDLLLARDEKVSGYLQSADGTFPAKASFEHTFAIRDAKDADNDPERISVQLRMLDVDGDGRADAVFTTTTSAGISSATTKIFLFFGIPGGAGFADKPDQVIENEGVDFIGTQIADLTGDGHPDLLLPSFKLGIMSIIRALTTKTLKVGFQLYPFGPNRRFAETPTAERTLKFKIGLSGRSDLQAVDMYGDYLGDKRLDLAFGTDDDELSLFGPGDAGKLFADDPMAKIKVRAFGEVRSIDLDGKGRSDLLLTYPNTKGHQNEIAVVHNHGIAK